MEKQKKQRRPVKFYLSAVARMDPQTAARFYLDIKEYRGGVTKGTIELEKRISRNGGLRACLG